MMRVLLNPNSLEDYRLFLRIKSLPKFSIVGRQAEFPDEYASVLGKAIPVSTAVPYEPISGLFDYQVDISRMAIAKRKFSIFAECGLGKTLMLFEYVRHVDKCLSSDRKILIVSPLMVVSQTLEECKTWYAGLIDIEQVRARDLQRFLSDPQGPRIGITNYEAISDDLVAGQLGCLALDESSSLKNSYGKWGTTLIRLGRGLEWKLCLTGTPAPNDRIEYANHAVFMDAFPNVNSFLAKFFINRGQTDNRWELKSHALRPFYTALSHWCIFLTNPGTYGWKDNCQTLPPMNVHIHNVDLTDEQRLAVFQETGELFVGSIGGITNRSKLGQIGKGSYNGKDISTNKPHFIRQLVDSWPDESTIIWCHYNHEQELMARTFPEAANISGNTPAEERQRPEERQRLVDAFKRGEKKKLISKGKILGFGLNLQICSRMVFSGLQDSYELFHQCVKRANRYGSTRPLNVHIPITEIEAPMVNTVIQKCHRVEQDTREQEAIFKGSMFDL